TRRPDRRIPRRPGQVHAGRGRIRTTGIQRRATARAAQQGRRRRHRSGITRGVLRMAETTTEGDLTGIEIKTGQKETSWQENLPVVGSAVKAFNDNVDAFDDGNLDPSEMGDIMSDSESFISSCADAISGLTSADPVHWLVRNGLDFLIATFEPLQDALHYVTGDGPALEQAAKNFADIGKGVEKIRTGFEEDVNKPLQDWKGEASETAGAR